MKLKRQRSAVFTTATLLGLLLLLPASEAGAQECDGADFCSEAEANIDADTGDSGNSGPSGDGGSGGGGGNSGAASAGDGVGGPGGSAGTGGDGGGNGGNGGGGGAAGGSGNYSGATIGNRSTSGSQAGAGVSPVGVSAESIRPAFGGGGGGPATASPAGAASGGSGGTFCADCSTITLGDSMVSMVSWKLGDTSARSTQGRDSEPESGNFASGLFLTGLLALILFAKAPLPHRKRLSHARRGV